MSPAPPAIVHIVGAGLAGLSAAVRLAAQGTPIRLYEAAGQAGGRCRSYDDKVLGCRIDNGNHLVLSGNSSTLAYARLVGSHNPFFDPGEAAFPFMDLATGERWTVRPNASRLPWWLLSAARRIPGTRPASYLAGLKLAMARPDQTVAQALDTRTTLFRRFWEPLVIAALNTTPDHASAQLVWRALRESFGKGADYCRPLIARDGLGEALVQPALAYLQQQEAEVRFNSRLRAIGSAEGRAQHLDFGGAVLDLNPGDPVILALPPSQLGRVMPGLKLPGDDAVIVNAHFRLDEALAPAGEPHFLGLLNAVGHWVFVRGDVVSITISAADRLGLAGTPESELLPVLWREVQQALTLEGRDYLAARLIRERRATFDQSPAGIARRPKAETALSNLFLAGDFTDTGLPATIEGAIRSGERAAALAMPR